MKNNWGSYSPFFDTGAKFDGVSVVTDCTLTQVHVLHRHAERYPTSGTGKRMELVADKLKQTTPSTSLSWLDDWSYTLGTDLLVPKGVGAEFESGANFWATHGRLLYNATEQGFLAYDRSLNMYTNGTQRAMPVLRSTSQSRIQTSARAWAAGFFGVYDSPKYPPVDNDELYKLVLITEQDGYNNTLASYDGCPNSNNDTIITGKARQDEWIQVYLADAAERLQKLLPEFSNFTADDAFQFQNLCAFETAAYGRSHFCDLFTETEWRGFEYAADLKFYGDSSFGTTVGKAGGVGWLTELLARLEERLILEPQNGINVSLTNNEQDFPLDQPFYLDMTHDSVMMSVLTALGFDFLKPDLPTNKIPVPRQFIVSRLTPFAARLFVEIVECDGKYVRLKLNNRALPLGSLPDCPDSKDGLCAFNKFISSLKKITDIDYDKVCYM
jgi:hypothetical protein